MLLHLSDHSPEPLRSQIARQLRSKILRGDLAPATLLPAEHRLARANRAGVVPVAAALEELVGEGLLIQELGGGFRVAQLSAAQRRALVDHAQMEDPMQQRFSLAELQLAREIQSRLLPPPVVVGEGFASIARWFPARFLAGDLYDIIPHPDGSVGMVVADVAGKGFAAALLMASVKAMTPFVAATQSVEGTLGELNRRLAADLAPREFVALTYARFEPRDNTVVLANAGMPDPLVLAPGLPPQEIEAPAPRLPLGLRRRLQYRSVKFDLHPGERLLLYSDGLPESRLPTGEPLGFDVFTTLVAQTPLDSTAIDQVAASEHFLDSVLASVQERTQPTPSDDCTAVILQHHADERRARCS